MHSCHWCLFFNSEKGSVESAGRSETAEMDLTALGPACDLLGRLPSHVTREQQSRAFLKAGSPAQICPCGQAEYSCWKVLFSPQDPSLSQQGWGGSRFFHIPSKDNQLNFFCARSHFSFSSPSKNI